ncbi:MAG: hypothetical protein ACP59X_14350 [Solidesulfovibrio sp. DCME]|uniref:hypothetical protein n=1 Tax=Solidesulfovibrio sp. DCME TaxID=3447380 RepID=UPI003D132687
MAYLDADGRIRLRFGQFVREEDRWRIRRVIERHYLALVRLQLDVPEGTKPRSVYQLMAAGRLRIGRDGRYVFCTTNPHHRTP